MFDWLPWALVTPWVISLGRRHPPSWKSPRTWLLHLACSVAIDVAVAAWVSALEVAFQPWLPDFRIAGIPGHVAAEDLRRPPAGIHIVCGHIGVTYVLDSKARAAAQQTDTARLNEQLSYAQLNALQRQIEPHFIFNALNAISGLVREQKNDCRGGHDRRAQRFPAQGRGQFATIPRCSSREEVEFLEKYLQIQEARFAGRLKVEIQIPHELRKAQIPSLILQPLVENAIKHGIAQRVIGGEVRVAAARADGQLHLSVYNDGPLLDRDGSAVKDGIGLSNLRTRLKLLYGSDCDLRLENYGITGVQVSMALPYREA